MKTVLAPARQLRFQGLGGSRSVLFDTFFDRRFEGPFLTDFLQIWLDLGVRFGAHFAKKSVRLAEKSEGAVGAMEPIATRPQIKSSRRAKSI